KSPGEHTGYEYSRTGNPTRAALEANLAALEGGSHGLVFASGCAATACIAHWVGAGAHMIVGDDLYGGTFRLFDKVFRHADRKYSYVDLTDPQALEAAIPPETKAVWIETPTNPMLKLADIAEISRRAHAHGLKVIVDNTFMSPYLQSPLALGADIVVHSCTKYLGGHSDVVMGAVVTNDAAIAERLHFIQNSAGGVPGPMDAYLVLRGTKTLAVRMDRHDANARAVVDLLVGHPAVQRVRYPQLPDHPGHSAAAKQMRDFGGMVSFELASEEEALAVVARTELFTLAESLGAVESLIEHPARMTHASAAGSALEVPPGLVRMAVGIESADDLQADLASALEAI
ncbi:MAG: aminotransferase class I/II-fold pyridoxal phosphate-dependent enzyme, partial [Myxococcales bacterium]|nr:aminotransferase class I/II-fold pyridoxal phosphate-dependent enzyme [Myxococcales bacterium]